MLEESVKQKLRQLRGERIEMVRYEREAREKLDSQIIEHEEQIRAIEKILGDEATEIPGQNVFLSNPTAVPAETRPNTVTDKIRRLFEENPHITPSKAIEGVRAEFPRSRISRQSFAQWNLYFRRGDYRMDPEKYHDRYGKEPPY